MMSLIKCRLILTCGGRFLVRQQLGSTSNCLRQLTSGLHHACPTQRQVPGKDGQVQLPASFVTSRTKRWRIIANQNEGLHTSPSTGSKEDILQDVKIQGNHIQVTWSDHATSRYHNLWLRKHCHCQACRHDNGQVLMSSFSLPSALTVKEIKVQPDGTIVFAWNEEDHPTVVPLQWMKENSYSRQDLQKASDKQDVSVFKGPIKEHSLKDLLTDQDKEYSFLRDINEDGVVIVKGVPCERGQVTKVAEIVSHVQQTLYGKTFMVEATGPDAINVAYTPLGLELHMDLMYYQSPPGLQLLHCIEFDENVVGGESVLLDSVQAALEMRQSYPNLFKTLLRVPATFQKIHFDRAVPAVYVYRRPHITVNPDGKISSVIWSPPFEGPLKVPEEDVEPYYEAYRKFAEVINTSPIKLCTRLQPGDCIVFNNMRILHARNEFYLNGGKRILEGCYVNIDDFKSRVQVVHTKTNSGDMAKRVNNGDYS